MILLELKIKLNCDGFIYATVEEFTEVEEDGVRRFKCL